MHPIPRTAIARPSPTCATAIRSTVDCSPLARLAVGVLALLALPLAGHAATDPAPWTDAPFETHGDDHRVREGHTADPGDLAADAERAATGVVIGGTAAHDALLRARPSSAATESRPDDRFGVEPDAGHPNFDTEFDVDTWIADIGVLLRRDEDGDGFFGAVDLSIDVDTADTERDVYAIIELTEPDGALTLSHVTQTFTVRGNATSDEYRIEIELLDNHVAAYRDVRIDVRDAWSDARLDEVSAFDFVSLRALPLEAERAPGPSDDGRHPLEQTDYALGVLLTGSSSHGSDSYHEGDAYVAGYAGAGGPLGAIALVVLAFGRRLARARRAGVA